MTRAEQRRAAKEKSKTVTYNFTEEQVRAMVRARLSEEIERIKQEATDDAINTALILLLTLPMEVLMDHYWQKSYRKRIPEFAAHLLEYYERWQNGEIDLDVLREDLWKYGGLKLVEEGQDGGE